MHPSFLLISLLSTLAIASLPPWNITDYISDTIGSFSYYSFTISYIPPATNQYNVPLCEPAFSTYCEWSTDDAGQVVKCANETLSTIGDFSTGYNLNLTVIHSWQVPKTAARPAGTITRTGEKTLNMYLGSAGVPYETQITAGAETFIPAVQKPGKERRGAGAVGESE